MHSVECIPGLDGQSEVTVIHENDPGFVQWCSFPIAFSPSIGSKFVRCRLLLASLVVVARGRLDKVKPFFSFVNLD